MRRNVVLVLGFSLFAFAGYGVTLAQVDHDPLKFYFEDNPLRVGIETLDEHVAGAGSMSVLVERDGGVKDLALLRRWRVSKSVFVRIKIQCPVSI